MPKLRVMVLDQMLQENNLGVKINRSIASQPQNSQNLERIYTGEDFELCLDRSVNYDRGYVRKGIHAIECVSHNGVP